VAWLVPRGWLTVATAHNHRVTPLSVPREKAHPSLGTQQETSSAWPLLSPSVQSGSRRAESSIGFWKWRGTKAGRTSTRTETSGRERPRHAGHAAVRHSPAVARERGRLLVRAGAGAALEAAAVAPATARKAADGLRRSARFGAMQRCCFHAKRRSAGAVLERTQDQGSQASVKEWSTASAKSAIELNSRSKAHSSVGSGVAPQPARSWRRLIQTDGRPSRLAGT
jgi:hypothetical protein